MESLQLAHPLFGPGGKYETTRVLERDAEFTVFKHAPQNLAELYKEAAEEHGEKVFFVYEDERFTFADAWDRASAVANALAVLGINNGDRVAIAMRNYPEWVFAFMGITIRGAVATCLNAWWSTDELAYGLDDSGARLLFVDEERLERVGSLLPNRSLDIVTVRQSKPNQYPTLGWDQFLEIGKQASDGDHEVATSDFATILYTSGSTAAPKGVVSTHRALTQAVVAWEASAAAKRLRKPKAATASGKNGAQKRRLSPAMILTVPLFHVTGLNAQLLASFRSARKLVGMYKWDAEEALKIIERERITQFSGVPTMAYELMQSPNYEKYDTSSLGFMTGGGAAMSPEHSRKIKQKTGNKVAPGTGYGMTETNALGTQVGGKDLLARPTSVGQPIAPLVSIKIVNASGQEVAPLESGEIWIHSATNFSGYWHRPDETEAALTQGWVHTGDIGHIDEDGFVFITDRIKDLIIRGGENIGTTEVESAILEHPAVNECAVFGIPDERLGEIVAAVVSTGSSNLNAETLQQFLRQQLAPFKVPERIEITRTKLPRVASGKIYKKGIKESFIQNTSDQLKSA